MLISTPKLKGKNYFPMAIYLPMAKSMHSVFLGITLLSLTNLSKSYILLSIEFEETHLLTLLNLRIYQNFFSSG